MAVLTAHQPNFCPWMPFFEKMDQADVFVMLHHVQYEKGGYQNRFQYKGRWYTMSVKSDSVEVRVLWKKYAKSDVDWVRITSAFPQMRVFDHCIGDTLSMTNRNIISMACAILGEDTSHLRHDYETALTGSERLIHLCQNWNCDTYLSGPSGKNYLDLDKFKKAGIEVKWFEAKDTRQLCEVL